MIDLHCHILPGLDDGAPTEAEALAMARAMVAAGITVAAATPHMGLGPGGDVTVARATAARVRLAAQLRAAGVPLALVPGGEHHVTAEMWQRARDGQVVPLGGAGTWLLVELPWHPIPRPADALFRMQAAGYQLLLAHPERYGYLTEATCETLVSRGVRLQLELGSFVGAYGGRAQARAAALMEAGLAYVLAGDLHRARQADAWLTPALAHVTTHYGASTVARLTEVQPAAILAAAQAAAQAAAVSQARAEPKSA